MENAEIERRFRFHKSTDEQLARHEQVRDLAKEYAFALVKLCPESRELSLALTHLETAVIFANASIARNE